MIRRDEFGLEFHDSWLESVRRIWETCLIAFRPSYVYEIDAKSGEIGPCMTVDAKFEFDHGSVNGVLGELPCPILDGSLYVESELIEDLIPVPFDSKGAITMKLFMWPDYRKIVIDAQGLRVQLEGVPLPD